MVNVRLPGYLTKNETAVASLGFTLLKHHNTFVPPYFHNNQYYVRVCAQVRKLIAYIRI